MTLVTAPNHNIGYDVLEQVAQRGVDVLGIAYGASRISCASPLTSTNNESLTTPIAVFRFLSGVLASGQSGALVLLTDVVGSSSREPGTVMAVAEDGNYQGSLSGGCVEAAVVGEALRIIGTGRTELIKLGSGSPFIDIRLPCGGGITLLVIPNPEPAIIAALVDHLSSRRNVFLAAAVNGSLALDIDFDCPLGWYGDVFRSRFLPPLLIIMVGHGAEIVSLTRLSIAYGAEALVLSPDKKVAADANRLGADFHLLQTPARSFGLVADENAAIIFMFHDHDWEQALMAQALEQPAFFIGAMGSVATDTKRRQALTENGVSDECVSRLLGPVGLIPAARDPDLLALSVLAQVVDSWRTQVGLRTARDARLSNVPPVSRQNLTSRTTASCKLAV